MIEEIKNLLPCNGTSEVFLLGEKEFKTKKERIAKGHSCCQRNLRRITRLGRLLH